MQDRPIRQNLRGHVYFALGAVDQGNVDVFKILARRIVNDRCRISATRRERSEKENCGYGIAQQVQTD